ncbi:hypothetical protein TC41_0123 [Alicyclobacillus acidocaldarius subsp. acidocaldarius Tc-4-1]|uniref:Uncharacterized protein n=1 Tax=Alicyclobacillus acidocaldarius (strain Tc-4-1) TaxID=1048834 RepID=F8IIE2_ALIAT|nr:hypothetical protein TC41_0123 [Alicyclobacillus acidocaldarius subsp. acidocaldarius Tc-4-1]
MVPDWLWGLAFVVGIAAAWAVVDIRVRRHDAKTGRGR